MNPLAPPEIPNPLIDFDASSLFGQVIGTLFLWAGAVALLFIIIGGFRFIISMGNPEGVEKARHTVLYAILGLIIIFLSYIIVVYLLGDLLGVRPAYRIGE
ncbi:MAG: hypothetical protein WD603_01430 [Patescibacteria group bacterium]